MVAVGTAICIEERTKNKAVERRGREERAGGLRRDRDKEGHCWFWTALQFLVPFFSQSCLSSWIPLNKPVTFLV